MAVMPEGEKHWGGGGEVIGGGKMPSQVEIGLTEWRNFVRNKAGC